jgi:RNA polymerase sigma-70 factor, ECF subfamily
MPSDSALDTAMDRYARGDDAAFAIVFAELAPRLRAFLRRLAGARQSAEDLLQETFLRIHRARGSFGEGARALPWAYAIARNCYIDHFRSARARPEVELEPGGDAPGHDPKTGPDADAEQTAIAMQTARIVERELARMTLARREAFVLLRYEGRSVAEAARILGTTQGAVKLRAFHAYEAIRAALRATSAAAPPESGKNERGNP